MIPPIPASMMITFRLPEEGIGLEAEEAGVVEFKLVKDGKLERRLYSDEERRSQGE